GTNEYTCIDWQNQKGRIVARGEARFPRPTTDYGMEHILKPLQSTTWYFQPEHIQPQPSPLAPDGQLLPNGENLAGVLQKLQSDFRLQQYTTLVQTVFPEILALSPRAVDQQRLELYLW